MDFRCANCLTSHWIDRVEPLGLSDAVVCPDCGKTHVANPVPVLGSTLGSHYRRTVEFAREMQVDLPSAYSVLLQFMTMDDVLTAGDLTKEEPDAARPVVVLEVEVDDQPVDERVQAPDEPTADALFPELSGEELSLLERLAADDEAGAASGFESTDDADAALFPELTSEELSLLDRLATGEETSTASGTGSIDDAGAALFPELSSEELNLLEQIEVEEEQNTLLPDLSETELGPLDGIIQEDDTDPAATPETEAARSLLLMELDPGFAKAVAKGRLPLQEALRRGNRSEYAREMARQHHLPMRLAYAVADNRVTLRKATLFRDAAHKLRRPATPLAPAGVPWWGTTLVLGIAATTVCLATWGLWTRNFSPSPAELRRAASPAITEQSSASLATVPAIEPTTHQQALRSATAVLTDEAGRITQVTGPDPGNVLRAFCEKTTEHGFFEPKEVTETVPSSREARLGVFRDLQSLTVNRAIRIRRDRQTRRWVAGDGVHPIQVMDQPNLPPGAFRMPVSAH